MTYWDRFKTSLASVLEQLVGARLDYLARYPARVVSQDGTKLELLPDDSRVPGIKGVPIRVGLPGLVLTVPPGARVLLAFEAGDPSKPVAEIWESGTPITVTIDASATIQFGKDALRGVARLGDTAGPYLITSASTKVLSE
jgi:hypothetical protein